MHMQYAVWYYLMLIIAIAYTLNICSHELQSYQYASLQFANIQ